MPAVWTIKNHGELITHHCSIEFNDTIGVFFCHKMPVNSASVKIMRHWVCKKSEHVDNDWHQVNSGSLLKQWVIYNPTHFGQVNPLTWRKFFSIRLCEFGFDSERASGSRPNLQRTGLRFLSLKSSFGLHRIRSSMRLRLGLLFGVPSGYLQLISAIQI